MNSKPNIFLIGLGGIGAAYASQAQDAGIDFKIICDPDRKKRYEANGFVVNGQQYQFNYLSEPEGSLENGIILISVKHPTLLEAIETIRPFVQKDTAIVSILNGLASEDILREQLQTDNVLPAYTVGTDSQRKHNVVTYSSRGKIVFGADKAENQHLADRVENALLSSGIGAEKSENIMQRMWWKFMANIGINQTCAMLRVPYQYYHEEGPTRNIARSAMREVIPLAQHHGIALDESDIEEVFRLICSVSGENKPSTLQDMEAGRPTEVDVYAKEVIRMGKEIGAPTPVNQLMYEYLMHYERGIRRTATPAKPHFLP